MRTKNEIKKRRKKVLRYRRHLVVLMEKVYSISIWILYIYIYAFTLVKLLPQSIQTSLVVSS